MFTVSVRGYAVPTFKLLANARIEIRANEHVPPHFHLIGPNSNALVDIRNLEILRGRASRSDFREAVAWAVDHMEDLLAEWSRLNERS